MQDEILIVGAGVAGLMTAIELAQAGIKPRLFDTGLAGMESSWAGGGILSPIYPWQYPDAVNDLALWSTRRYPDYFAQLKQATSINPQWLACGHLILQVDNNEPTITHWASRYSANMRQLDQKQLREIEPTLSEHFTHGLWLSDIGQVRNPRLIRALTVYAEKLGATIQENTKVVRLLHTNGRVTGIETQTDKISASRVLITAGAWSAQFNLGNHHLAIEPVKGQMIQLQTTANHINRITLHEGRYVIPRQDGKVLIGSTQERTGFEKSIDDPTREELHTIAGSIHPLLKDAPVINHWAGLRPGNERQTPYIGEHPEYRGLYFNTGHYRNGIVMGLASARLCADIITGNPPILSSEPYRLTDC